MSANKLHFIVVDDSKLDCFIAEKIIRNTGKSDSIKSFVKAEEALEYIRDTPHPNDGSRTVLLIDIQMPVMSGFEFVEAFEKLPLETTQHYLIYILSSSINENDLNRVRYHSSVKQFLNKPLTSNTLSTLLEMV